MEPEVTQALKDTENALRDFIGATLGKSLGSDWIKQCGVSQERIDKWSERKAIESKRQSGGVVEARLIYYADFYDITTILKKHWAAFTDALGEWKTMEVFLNQLEKLRDPDAHRRELLPHQKHLAAGIAGEIRTRLIRYRSKLETSEDYFPRIESARDSLGSIWTPSHATALHLVQSGHILRPGDVVDYVITASDPMGEALEYAVGLANDWTNHWQKQNSFSVTILEKHIRKRMFVRFEIRSQRAHHASGGSDDSVEFVYTVLPAK